MELESGHKPETMSRDELRGWAQTRRKTRTPDSAGVCEQLTHWLSGPDRPPGWVVVYDSMPGEVDLSDLLDSGLGPFATTRTPSEGWDLTIHPWGSKREIHPYGYSQPVAEAEVVEDSEVSVVLVPALVFDRSGQRLGWGAGYYDRFLARLGSGVAKVGVSDGAIVGSIPTEPHDIGMDLVVTADATSRIPSS